MNAWLLAAGSGSAALALVHVFAGGKEVHQPMLATALPAGIKAVWTVVWHAVTAMLLLNGGFLLLAGLAGPEQARALAALPVAMSLAFAVLFVGYGILRLGTLWIMPQWVGFGLIAALGLVGLA